MEKLTQQEATFRPQIPLSKGVRCIDLITVDGKMIEYKEQIHTATRQPTPHEFIALKNHLKKSG